MVEQTGPDYRDALMSLGPEGRLRNPHLAWLDGRLVLTAIQLVCGSILAIDVGYEIHANMVSAIAAEHYGSLHLGSEIFATILLFAAFGLSSRHLMQHRAELRQAEERARTIRGDFAGLVSRRFAEWALSPTEAEIALLTLKGLRIAEIARLRDNREGTVKAHLGAIFRKSGATSRPEFLAKFVDDFLDFAAEAPEAPAGTPV